MLDITVYRGKLPPVPPQIAAPEEATMGPKRIAKMIRANVAALDSGKITIEQFGRVNEATWRLADRDEPCIIGSTASNRVAAVHREFRRMGWAV